jgi:hypothetical protein
MLLGYSAMIAAPAREVFACVDEPDRIVKWVGGAVEHVYVSERSTLTAVGQKFRQQLRQGKTIRTFHGEIIAWEPHTHFGLRIPTDAYTSEAHFRIKAIGVGFSSIDYSIDISLHTRPAKFIGPILKLPLRLFVAQQIRRLKMYAESLQVRSDAYSR